MPDFVSLSNVFIDDILIWDGRIFIGVLGGAGVHAVAGARVWSDSIGLVASIGEDFEDAFAEKLRALGMDMSMLRVAQKKTTRAWQIFQPDEERIEIFRDKKNLVHQLSLEEVALTKPYQNAKGYHIHFDGSCEQLISNFNILRSHNSSAKIVMEPTINERMMRKDEYSQIFQYLDVFSPNELEAADITGLEQPEKMVETLLAWGAKRVSLRMGGAGSLIGAQDQDLTYIPAIKETLVDVTGAGNAYLGGLLVGISEGLSFKDAALYGAVSASFAIEQFGVCIFTDEMKFERDMRLSVIKQIEKDQSGMRTNYGI